VVFEDADGDLWIRGHDGSMNPQYETDSDVLPVEVKEPRTVEGFVWVNEYEGHKCSDMG
jgi:hypothetical protein